MLSSTVVKKNLEAACPAESMQVLLALKKADFESYFAGGCVRDLLLGHAVHDFDVVTAATPEQVAQVFGVSKLVGSNFAVSLVKVGDVTTEVATMRLDGAYSDGRRPDNVEYTTNVKEDVARRDFTVNALLLNEYGQVFDYVGGLQDLQNGYLRTVGDPVRRFTEDALRLMRLVRFAVKLNFELDPDTQVAAQQMAGSLARLSGERLRDELSKMLLGPRPDQAVDMLDRLGMFRYVLPEVCAMHGVDQNPAHHPEGDVYVHTLGLLSHLQPGSSLTLALAALLHDVAKPVTAVRKPSTGQNTFHGHEDVGAEMADTVLRRLVFPNEVVDVVVSHVKQHMDFLQVRDMRRGKLARFVRQENFAELHELHRLDSLASGGTKMDSYNFVADFLNEVPAERLRPARLVTGDDLVSMGLKPGPKFRELLEAVETAQLEGRLSTRDEALELVKEMAR